MDSAEEHPDVQQPHAPSPMVWVELLVRVSVGCLLIFSGTIKLQDLNSFIGSLNTMELPLLSSNAGLLGLFADSLPWFEIGLGVLLVLGICARGATIVAAGLFIIFTTILASLLVQGLVINCGCLGPLLSSTVTWFHAGLDLVLAGACIGAAMWKGERMFSIIDPTKKTFPAE